MMYAIRGWKDVFWLSLAAKGRSEGDRAVCKKHVSAGEVSGQRLLQLNGLKAKPLPLGRILQT